MNFNNFSVFAKAASPLVPRGKDTAQYTIYDKQKFTQSEIRVLLHQLLISQL